MTNGIYGGLATDFLHQFSAFWASVFGESIGWCGSSGGGAYKRKFRKWGIMPLFMWMYKSLLYLDVLLELPNTRIICTCGCSGSPIIYCSIVLYTIVYIVFIVVADRLFIAFFHSIDFTLWKLRSKYHRFVPIIILILMEDFLSTGRQLWGFQQDFKKNGSKQWAFLYWFV